MFDKVKNTPLWTIFQLENSLLHYLSYVPFYLYFAEFISIQYYLIRTKK